MEASKVMVPLLSEQLLVTAAAIRTIRARLDQLVISGSWPEGSFNEMSVILNEGLAVARAMESLAKM